MVRNRVKARLAVDAAFQHAPVEADLNFRAVFSDAMFLMYSYFGDRAAKRSERRIYEMIRNRMGV